MITLAGTDTVVKFLTTDYAIAQVLWIRYLLFAGFGGWAAFSAVPPGSRPRRFAAAIHSNRIGLQIFRGTTLVVANVVIVYSFSQLPLADVHAVLAAAPLVVTAGSVVFFAEQVGVRRWLAVGAGFTGIMIILRPGVGLLDLTALAPVVGALLYASYQLLTKLVSRHDTQGVTQFYTGLCGLVWFSLAVPWFWTSPDPAGWTLLLSAAVLGTLAHLLIIKGLHLAPASTVQPFTYSMLVAAAVFGYAFFGEVPDRFTVVGAAIVVASGLYAFHRERLRVNSARKAEDSR